MFWIKREKEKEKREKRRKKKRMCLVTLLISFISVFQESFEYISKQGLPIQLTKLMSLPVDLEIEKA